MKELKFQLGNLKSNGNCFPNAQKKEFKKIVLENLILSTIKGQVTTIN